MLIPENSRFFQSPARIAVRLKNKGAQAVRKGHPWVFEDSIERISASGSPGDIAVLFDSSGKQLLGAGLYDPCSSVRVRVLAFGRKNPPVGILLFQDLVKKALEHRLPHLPPYTNGWRVVHGESDSFSGLVADRYAETLVMKIYSAAWLPWIPDVMKAVRAEIPDLKRSVIRYSREVRNLLPEDFPLKEGSVVSENDLSFTGIQRFRENGIEFEADVIRGQKTGFFLDQRDNRARVMELSAGKKVLNVFSFSGGFTLYAAKGGASSVVSVDMDRHAAESIRVHFELNRTIPGIASCEHEEIVADAFDAMRDLFKSGRRFDIVIVDPPSFAKAEAEVPIALKTYSRLARAAVRLLVPDGILVFASCSSRVTADRLFETVGESVRQEGFYLDEIMRTGHAVDHPARFRESLYLKCLFAHARKKAQ